MRRALLVTSVVMLGALALNFCLWIHWRDGVVITRRRIPVPEKSFGCAIFPPLRHFGRRPLGGSSNTISTDIQKLAAENCERLQYRHGSRRKSSGLLCNCFDFSPMPTAS